MASHANYMQHVPYTEMLGKAIWRLRIQENPLAAGARPRTPLFTGSRSKVEL